MTKPQQPELARSGRGEVDPHSAKTRTGGPTDATAPTGAIPDENLPGHKPDHDQDKPEGPPPRPRARKPTAATATATATAATATATQAATEVSGAAKATITDLTEARQQRAEGSFRFAFEPRVAPLSMAFGITPWTSGVELVDGELRVRFGPWSLTTPLDNVASAEVTGPYSFLKVAGPAHLSFADRGVTFATSTRQGVCIRFKKPVPAIEPRGLIKHPGLTVTVEDAEELVELLSRR